MKSRINHLHWLLGMSAVVVSSSPAFSQQVREYGDEDLCNTGTYSANPKLGATLYGLTPGTVTVASKSFAHSFPFSPTASDYSGTDQIYVGAVQTGAHDGYSNASQRIRGPQIVTLDYGTLIPAGQTIQTLTLGIGADDFQYTPFGQPFTASLNGAVNTPLTTALNALNQTGPYTQFLTVGIDPAVLKSSNLLTLSINEGGDGGDGWAIDFLTVGVTTGAAAVPEPGSLALLTGSAFFGGSLLLRRRCK